MRAHVLTFLFNFLSIILYSFILSTQSLGHIFLWKHPRQDGGHECFYAYIEFIYINIVTQINKQTLFKNTFWAQNFRAHFCKNIYADIVTGCITAILPKLSFLLCCAIQVVVFSFPLQNLMRPVIAPKQHRTVPRCWHFLGVQRVHLLEGMEKWGVEFSLLLKAWRAKINTWINPHLLLPFFPFISILEWGTVQDTLVLFIDWRNWAAISMRLGRPFQLLGEGV